MGSKKTIMLVDDSKVSRLMLKAIIENHFPDWHILEAENAATALKISLYENDNVDLITLDMNMPGTDGLTIAPQLKNNCTQAVIALLTGNVTKEVRAKAEQQGLMFIAKPITEDKVIEFVNSYNSPQGAKQA
ncbi:response regulator [Alkalimarinus sediminis]|uniref:Response regulator n=1 Tax=Alkalimarinus sediminis TaxID=1632866 RepID=A0A9E8KQN5_9ALTE|nr:response regulator [Alkalimarinus sediminis]UZW75365.1 response regulator [Alkalimarinus sediminis]